jgi:CubicO group peptidase (beta-lactamase class C family)
MKHRESRRLSLLWAIFLMLLTFPAGCGQADRLDASDPFARARNRIQRLMEKQQIASFQVAVARDGKIIYEEAFGWANVEQKIPTTTRTMHLVASIARGLAARGANFACNRPRI